MRSLTEIWDNLKHIYEINGDSRSVEVLFVERLTFSASEEITTVLNDVYEHHFLDMPPWLRNLAFRLACLLEPKNPKLLRRAAYDLTYFGPDWDEEAKKLLEEAIKIEEQNNSGISTR